MIAGSRKSGGKKCLVFTGGAAGVHVAEDVRPVDLDVGRLGTVQADQGVEVPAHRIAAFPIRLRSRHAEQLETTGSSGQVILDVGYPCKRPNRKVGKTQEKITLKSDNTSLVGICEFKQLTRLQF